MWLHYDPQYNYFDMEDSYFCFYDYKGQFGRT